MFRCIMTTFERPRNVLDTIVMKFAYLVSAGGLKCEIHDSSSVKLQRHLVKEDECFRVVRK